MVVPSSDCLIIFMHWFKKLDAKRKILALEFSKLVKHIIEAARSKFFKHAIGVCVGPFFAFFL
jgi:hypothetical protein